MYIELNKIEVIQLDITTLCNALCVFCPRTSRKHFDNRVELTVNPKLPLKSLSLETISNIFSEQNINDLLALKAIRFIPSYGDPLMVENLIEIINFLKINIPNVHINIHTNGSIRKPIFYTKLANALSYNKKNNITFSIDGLNETNNFYRKNIKWDDIIKNAQAFIDANGNAIWKTVKFDFNSNQLVDMKKIATDMGFKEFRTTHNRGDNELTEIEKNHAVYSFKKGEKKYPLSKHEKEYNEYKQTNYSTNIKCPWQNKNNIYIDIESRLWPCCYYANSVFSNNVKNLEIDSLFNKYGKDFNNLNKFTFKEILNNDFFTNIDFTSIICHKACKNESKNNL